MFISALLLAMQAAPVDLDRDFLLMLQCPGFIVAASIWGIHAGGIFFLLVMVSVNAAVYGLIAFGLFSLGGRPNRAN